MTATPTENPVLTFEGKRYDLNALPDELKELVRGMQVADAQLRMHEDTLKVLAVGRQSLAMQLNERLKNVTPPSRQRLIVSRSTTARALCRKKKPPQMRRLLREWRLFQSAVSTERLK